MSKINFEKDQRVQAHPATDAWMKGDRYHRYARAREILSGAVQ